MKKSAALFIALALVTVVRVQAYGPQGHATVGAIADRLLANTPTGAKVSALLDGYTLEEVATIPDSIKAWDRNGVDNPTAQHYFSSHPKIAEQLRAFWKANPPTNDEKSPIPNHHWFHYTDVPLAPPFEKYGDGKVGRSQWDIVHMMRYCIGVLKGTIPANNPRAITKPIAIILLAHYVGDIHQPLHVGAEYFDAQGNPANPDQSNGIFGDEGGNALHLKLDGLAPPGASKRPNLHGFWDSDTVLANLPSLDAKTPKEERRRQEDAGEAQLATRLAQEEPKNWRLPPGVKVEDYPESWANEILPIARAAHDRLRFDHVQPKLQHDEMLAMGNAVERPMPDGLSYRKWSAGVVLNELHLAGWRLADLLKQVLNGSAAPSVAAPITAAQVPILAAPEKKAAPLVIHDADFPPAVIPGSPAPR
ncbi:MAG TPA: S1/P1 nuclease [Chthoniobacterales bacterium]|nr:S1/P1 nuclease [Chthoniobacterales bacterium]